MSYYLASPLFTAREKDRILEVSTYLRSKGYDVYSPMEHTVNNAWSLPNNEWARQVYEEDIRALDVCDKLIVIYDGLYSDTGTAWEVGYAYAKGKKIIVLYTENEESTSLMMMNGCHAAIYYRDFRNYDFDKEESMICDADQR